MLKLKRVEIQGFKSFCDRTEMKFSGSGIAAVVGPNGCGKSNLSDAISWVLGEQSAKTLRGSRMEDVIFAGTRDRKPLSMASVTMTLLPDESALPVVSLPAETGQPVAAHRGEITITRRLYRSGDSEYLVNGKHARLRDIQELFLGTGLGPESYAIIEQGRIGQILSNKPQDRRAVIEEAAGVTKFKTRKRLAEAKLESAKQNLSRVFDILEEVTRQVNTLKRQAAKTKRYGELRAEAVAYLKEILAARFRMLERETAKLTIELNLTSTHLQNAQAAIAGREQEQTQVFEASYSTEQELTAARKLLADLHLEAERARAKLEYQTKQIQQIEHRLSASGIESENLARQEAERSVELEHQGHLLDEIDIQLAQAQEQLQIKAAERQQAQQRLSEQERELEASRHHLLKLLGECSSLKNGITQVEAQLATADRDAARANAEEQQSTADLARIQQLRADLSDRLSARQTELVSVTGQRNEVEQQLHTSRAHLSELRHAVDRLRGEHSRIKARRDSLEEVIQHRSYTTETVKRLFTTVERGRTNLQPIGVLADFLEVDPQIEKATEEFLHDELEYVVVRHWTDAESGIELMRGDVNGRATFLVEAGADSPAHGFPAPNLEPGKLTPLTDSLRFTNGLTNIPVTALPRIANCFVSADRSLAQTLAPQFPHCWFLSSDGVSYHGHAVSGGKKTGAGPLALKRELREASQLERAKAEDLAAAQERMAQLEVQVASLNEQLDALRAQQQREEKDVLSLDHECRKAAEESQRAKSRLSRAKLDLERISRDRVNLEQSLARDRVALEQTEAARAGQEAALESARDELASLQREVAHAAEEHASIRAGLASLEERQRSAAAHKQRLDIQLRDLANRRERLALESG
ncbi:MAG: AAA family ATPase, partial [Acidobacteriaceae bacterium]|nr:AAA family ATPase [Acidobacteriaceae bacterium]